MPYVPAYIIESRIRDKAHRKGGNNYIADIKYPVYINGKVEWNSVLNVPVPEKLKAKELYIFSLVKGDNSGKSVKYSTWNDLGGAKVSKVYTWNSALKDEDIEWEFMLNNLFAANQSYILPSGKKKLLNTIEHYNWKSDVAEEIRQTTKSIADTANRLTEETESAEKFKKEYKKAAKAEQAKVDTLDKTSPALVETEKLSIGLAGTNRVVNVDYSDKEVWPLFYPEARETTLSEVRYLGNEDYFRIGDTVLLVPPANINVETESTVETLRPLRSEGSLHKKNGKAITKIQLSIAFPDSRSIYGSGIDDPNCLAALVAQFKRAPFLPVVNNYLNYTQDIWAVTLANLTFQTMKGVPNAIDAQLTLYRFNVESYMPQCGGPLFEEAFCWPIFRKYYNFNSGIQRRLEHTMDGEFQISMPKKEYLKKLLEEQALASTSPEKGELDSAQTSFKEVDKVLSPKTKSDKELSKRRTYDAARIKEHGPKIKVTADTLIINDWLTSATQKTKKVTLFKITSRKIIEWLGKERPAGFIGVINAKEFDLNYTKHGTQITHGMFEQIQFPMSATSYTKSTQNDKNWSGCYVLFDANKLKSQFETVHKAFESYAKRATEHRKRIKQTQAGYFDPTNTDVFKLTNLTIQNITTALENVVAELPTQLSDTPLHQYFGSSDTFVRLEAVGDETTVATLRSIVARSREYEREYGMSIARGFVKIDNEIANLAGMEFALFEDVVANTRPGFPELFDIELLLHDFKPTERRLEELNHFTNALTKDGKEIYESTWDSERTSLLANVERTKHLKSMELYPDLSLPLYSEVSEWINSGLSVSLRQKLPKEGFVDPDFYIAADNAQVKKKALKYFIEEDSPASVKLTDKERRTALLPIGKDPEYDNALIADIKTTIADFPPEVQAAIADSNVSVVSVKGSASAKKWQSIINNLSKEEGVPNALARAVLYTESRDFTDERAATGTYIGPMQCGPDAFAEVKKHLPEPEKSKAEQLYHQSPEAQARYGMKYLKLCLDKAQRVTKGGPRQRNTMLLAYAMYHNGETEAIEKYKSHVTAGIGGTMDGDTSWINSFGPESQKALNTANKYLDNVKSEDAEAKTTEESTVYGNYTDPSKWSKTAVNDLKDPYVKRGLVILKKELKPYVSAPKQHDPNIVGSATDQKYLYRINEWDKKGGSDYVVAKTKTIALSQQLGIPMEKLQSQLEEMCKYTGMDLNQSNINLLRRMGKYKLDASGVTETLQHPKDLYKGMCYDMVENSDRGRLLKAFPTFVCVLVDGGKWLTYWRLWDHFYGYSAVTSIEVRRNREEPADIALVSLANVYRNLTNYTIDQEILQAHDTRSCWTFADLMSGVWQHIMPHPNGWIIRRWNDYRKSLMLKTGARLHIRLGYGSDATKLPILFNGTITDVPTAEPGGEVTVVAMGDGIEFTNEIEATEVDGGDTPVTNWHGVAGIGTEPHDALCGLFAGKKNMWEKTLNLATMGGMYGRNPYGIEHFGYVDFDSPFYYRIGEAGQNIYRSGDDPYLDETYMPMHYVGLAFAFKTDLFGLWSWLSGNELVMLHVPHATPWKMTKTITSALPDFISAIEPFEFRSTLFFGKPWYPYCFGYRTHKIDSKGNVVPITAADVFAKGKRGDGSTVLEKLTDFELRKPYSQFHVLTSHYDIITNKITASEEDVYTIVQGTYTNDRLKGEDEEKLMRAVMADSDIYPEKQKMTIVQTGLSATTVSNWINLEHLFTESFTTSKRVPLNAAINYLADSIRHMYKGHIAIMGDGWIKPYDLCYIADTYSRLNGLVNVRAVTHHMSLDTGFVTNIEPDCAVCSTDSQVPMLWGWFANIGASIATYLAVFYGAGFIVSKIAKSSNTESTAAVGKRVLKGLYSHCVRTSTPEKIAKAQAELTRLKQLEKDLVAAERDDKLLSRFLSSLDFQGTADDPFAKGYLTNPNKLNKATEEDIEYLKKYLGKELRTKSKWSRSSDPATTWGMKRKEKSEVKKALKAAQQAVKKEKKLAEKALAELSLWDQLKTQIEITMKTSSPNSYLNRIYQWLNNPEVDIVVDGETVTVSRAEAMKNINTQVREAISSRYKAAWTVLGEGSDKFLDFASANKLGTEAAGTGKIGTAVDKARIKIAEVTKRASNKVLGVEEVAATVSRKERFLAQAATHLNPIGIIEMLIFEMVLGNLRNWITRYERSRQAVWIFPLKKNGKEFSAGINGHMGAVVGDQPGVVDKVLNFCTKTEGHGPVGKLLVGLIGNFMLGIEGREYNLAGYLDDEKEKSLGPVISSSEMYAAGNMWEFLLSGENAAYGKEPTAVGELMVNWDYGNLSENIKSSLKKSAGAAMSYHPYGGYADGSCIKQMDAILKMAYPKYRPGVHRPFVGEENSSQKIGANLASGSSFSKYWLKLAGPVPGAMGLLKNKSHGFVVIEKDGKLYGRSNRYNKRSGGDMPITNNTDAYYFAFRG